MQELYTDRQFSISGITVEDLDLQGGRGSEVMMDIPFVCLPLSTFRFFMFKSNKFLKHFFYFFSVYFQYYYND